MWAALHRNLSAELLQNHTSKDHLAIKLLISNQTRNNDIISAYLFVFVIFEDC